MIPRKFFYCLVHRLLPCAKYKRILIYVKNVEVVFPFNINRMQDTYRQLYVEYSNIATILELNTLNATYSLLQGKHIRQITKIQNLNY